MRIAHRAGWAAIGAVIVSSCSPKPEAVIGRHRAAAEAQVGRLEAIGALVKAAAPLELEAVELEGPPPDFPPYFGKENAAAMAPEHFDDLGNQSKEYRLVAHNPVADAVSLLRKGTFADGSRPAADRVAKIEDLLRRLEALRYVLVVRTTGGREPQSLGSEFVGGRWEGEAVLYDLQAGTRLGGFAFTAENDQTVDVEHEQAGAWLLANLRENALAAVRAEMKSRFPSGNPPFADEAKDGPAR